MTPDPLRLRGVVGIAIVNDILILAAGYLGGADSDAD